LQVTDGAAACLMMTRREALRRGLPILGIFRSFAAVGVDPAIMGGRAELAGLSWLGRAELS
jgi:acetyl-CoA acyltransferase 1